MEPLLALADWLPVLYAGLAMLGVIVGWVWIRFRKKCPKCRRWNALKPTGNTRGLRYKQDEWKCEFCKQVVWQPLGGGGNEGKGGGNGGG